MRYTIMGSGSDGSERTIEVDADDEIEALSLGQGQGIVRSTAIRVRMSFTATEAWVGEDYWVFSAGVRQPDPAGHPELESRYELSLERGGEDDEMAEIDPEWSREIQLSYRQGNEPYLNGKECVSACRLERNTLEIDLSRPLGHGLEIAGFVVRLDVDDRSYAALRDGLQWIFRNRSGILVIDEGGA
jgi:hypothetical protein